MSRHVPAVTVRTLGCGRVGIRQTQRILDVGVTVGTELDLGRCQKRCNVRCVRVVAEETLSGSNWLVDRSTAAIRRQLMTVQTELGSSRWDRLPRFVVT